MTMLKVKKVTNPWKMTDQNKFSIVLEKMAANEDTTAIMLITKAPKINTQRRMSQSGINRFLCLGTPSRLLDLSHPMVSPSSSVSQYFQIPNEILRSLLASDITLMTSLLVSLWCMPSTPRVAVVALRWRTNLDQLTPTDECINNEKTHELMTKLQTAFCRVGEICLNDIFHLSRRYVDRSDVGKTLEEFIHIKHLVKINFKTIQKLFFLFIFVQLYHLIY